MFTGARVPVAIAIVGVILFATSALAQVDSRGEEFFVERGRRNFRVFCSSCHGLEGTGDGPIAEHLKVPPADVTQIARRFDGVFPEAWVHEVIDGRARVRGHGTEEMPVWGDVFQSPMVEVGGRPITQGPNSARQKIQDLVLFLSRIQETDEEPSED